MDKSIPSTLIARPCRQVAGCVRVPGDKSITHRSIMLGSIANGITTISNGLMGDDCIATLCAMEQLGVKIERALGNQLVIHGVGMQGLKKPQQALDLGNSGTAIRLLMGLLAGANISTELVGDSSLNSRPMMRVSTPLQQMGAAIQLTKKGTAPIKLSSHKGLHGVNYMLPVASAQVKSAILLAALYATGETVITEPGITRDHTERMLLGFGAKLSKSDVGIRLTGGQSLRCQDIHVPSDISSAAFFIVAACIAAEAELLIKDVGINPTRTGIIDILKLMGADITLIPSERHGAEPIADIIVKPAKLHGIEIPHALVPLAIDEFPVIFIAAACAKGVTVLSGAAELRVKESDRLQVMANGLTALGVVTELQEDGIHITGGQINGGTVQSHGDHRIAMAFTIASLRAEDAIIIHDCENIATSFPDFLELCQQIGLYGESYDH